MNATQPGQQSPLCQEAALQGTLPFQSGKVSSARALLYALYLGVKKWLLSCVLMGYVVPAGAVSEGADYTLSISAECRSSRILLLLQKQELHRMHEGSVL